MPDPTPVVSANEAARLAELADYAILDTPPEQAFQDLVTIAAAVCDTPIANVTLIDRDRQWIKAAVGMQPFECRREDSFCTHAILAPHQLTVVPDTLDAQCRVGDRPATGSPLSVAIIDIDFFKAINDRYGHPVGDEVLVRVGQALAANAPEGVFVARIGGEEFAVVLSGRDTGAAVAVCEAMRSAVAALESTHPVTVSIGLTACGPGDDVSGLYARADRALYRAKQTGRDRVVVLD